jgi:hypothetical protein
MANKRGQLNCSKNTKNTGYGSCPLDWGLFLGAFIFDSPRVFTDAELADLATTLNDAATDDVKDNRMYPIHGFVAPTDNSEKVVTEKFDYGAEAIVRDGNINWSFQFVDGGACVNNAGRTHNGQSYVLFYDRFKGQNRLIGTYNAAGLATIPLQYVYFAPFTLRTGSKTTGYNVMFSFLPQYINEEVDFIQADFDLSEIKGLKDVDVIVNSFNQNTGVVNFTLQTDCGANNVYDLFNADITAASFVAYDDDGNAIAIDTLVGVAGNKTFNATLHAASFPDSGNITFGGAAVSVLAGHDIEGYEFGTVELEVVGS